MTPALIQHIQQLLPGYEVPQQELAAYFTTQQLPAETVLLQENQPCTELYFVDRGCLYLYYSEGGDKQVIHFALENWWLTDYKTFADGKPAVYAIATMEETEISSVNRKDYEKLLWQFPMLALYFNKIHERAYGAALYKQRTFATTSKPDFYRYFRHTYPGFTQKVPDVLFASYMGVSVGELQALQRDFVS